MKKEQINDNLIERAETEIHSVRIFPGIGIARVGNSPDDFFIGPEAPWEEPNSSGKYKDAMGRVKRQAARFRVYAFDKNGVAIRELTAVDGDINWTAHLANKKSSYYKFAGRFNQDKSPANLRNQTFKDADKTIPIDERDPDERTEWIIDPGPKSISGVNQTKVVLDGGKIKDLAVTLGELRTDEKGRLLVMGGFGKSTSLIANNPPDSYANNNNWHDDTSDGTIGATIKLKNGAEFIADSAWILVAPPKFAPSHYNLVSLYDRIKERSVPAADKETLFYKDIYPILLRASDYSWVSGMSYRAHGSGKGGNFTDPVNLAVLSSTQNAVIIKVDGQPVKGKYTLVDKTINCKEARMKVFNRIRKPIEWEWDESAKRVIVKDEEQANKQANYYFMPQLSGDDGDALSYPIAPGSVSPDEAPPVVSLTWLTVLPSQYKHLENWANGDFVLDAKEVFIPIDDYPMAEQPEKLDRGALEHCVGGPFFPGIEMTFVSDEPATFRAPFRIADVYREPSMPVFRPGDITRYMALPWQADFYQCNTHWWPAQRPDNVVTEDDYLEALKLLNTYKPDDNTPIDPNIIYASTLTERPLWARGLSDFPNNAEPGDANMVKYWHEMGFVTKRTTPEIVYRNNKYSENVFVEQERNPYAGQIPERDLFYMIQNVDNFPGILGKVREYVEECLSGAAAYAHDVSTPEVMRYFEYSPGLFEARMMEAYNSFVADVSNYDPATDAVFSNKKAVMQRIIQNAPFNLTDGAWLRHIDKAGPTDDVQSLLSSIFQDERGNGDPSMNHCNIYLGLCHSIGYYPKAVDSEAFAQDNTFLDSAFSLPTFELAISQFTESYLPEILGMSLYLEWSVIEPKPTIELMEYYGIDPHFYVMHVGIDNAVNGHGRRALDAIKLYLAEIMTKGGEAEVQRQFGRIWTGYVAFSWVGTAGQDLQNLLLNAPSLQDKMITMVQAKKEFGSLNHEHHMVGGNKINDWFSYPEGFLQALIKASYIVPGNIEGSKFFSLLEFQNGPMFRVFTDDEIQLWKDWTLSLANPPKPKPVNSYLSMVKLITALKDQQAGSPNHKAMEIREPGTDIGHSISWWFEQDPVKFMYALSDEKNGLIVKYDPDKSLFVTNLIAPENRMGQAFSYVIDGAGGKTGRQIIIKWINDGCPLEEAIQAPITALSDFTREKLWLTSSQKKFNLHPTKKIVGMGTIH